jgi:hypothetical protein
MPYIDSFIHSLLEPGFPNRQVVGMSRARTRRRHVSLQRRSYVNILATGSNVSRVNRDSRSSSLVSHTKTIMSLSPYPTSS